ncbi:Protein N-terminal glutamine amidohydrolase [Termitomyces sp. T112]|nr:Protein N-terminal glutamine amidohydrolase [Termitomyces sp. T112]
MPPPPLPKTPYTSCYCEENIYLLAQAFLGNPDVSRHWEIFVVFISNSSKSVALWNQKRALEQDLPVVWDYHVVLLLGPREEFQHPTRDMTRTATASVDAEDKSNKVWIYDCDTRLPLPCVLEDYMFSTFMDVPPHYERIIPGDVFLKQFASDRSHMLVAEDDGAVSQASDQAWTDLKYIAPPPSYEPIRGTSAVEKGVVNNLMSSFVDMASSERTFGHVIDKAAMSTRM